VVFVDLIYVCQLEIDFLLRNNRLNCAVIAVWGAMLLLFCTIFFFKTICFSMPHVASSASEFCHGGAFFCVYILYMFKYMHLPAVVCLCLVLVASSVVADNQFWYV
jgi:mannose/fructose/N-acetylgalactosamine-specific phosphotransferase system component IIC